MPTGFYSRVAGPYPRARNQNDVAIAINSSYYLLAGCRDCAFAALPCPSAVVLQQLIGMAARVLVLGPADTQAVARIVSSRQSSPSCQRVRRRWLPCRRTGQCTRRRSCCCSGTGRRRCVVVVGSYCVTPPPLSDTLQASPGLSSDRRARRGPDKGLGRLPLLRALAASRGYVRTRTGQLRAARL